MEAKQVEKLSEKDIFELNQNLTELEEELEGISSSGYGVAIAERKYINEKLRETLKELSDIKFALDQSAIVAITDEKGIIHYVNDKFCELSKYKREQLLGKTHSLINSHHHSPEFFKELWLTIQKGEVWKGEIKNKAQDGSYYWVDTTIVPFLDAEGKPYQYLAIRFDITERKKTEEALRQSDLSAREQNQQLELALSQLKKTQSQLVQTEKISSLGQMVAGVAHEVNNPLSFISSNLYYANQYIFELLKHLQLYQKYFPNPGTEIENHAEVIDLEFMSVDLPKLLESMVLGTDRLREIMLLLRNFSRADEGKAKPVNLHEGLDSTLMILQHRLKQQPERPAIKVLKEYGNIPLVECYSGQMNQVFMNLIANAIDALDEESTGCFYGEIEQNPNIIVISTEMIAGDKVAVRIRDNGPGIPEAVQARLFESFFTTKPEGKGTGLGLAISYQIVTEIHKGQLKCFSSPVQGCEFVIEIPILREDTKDVSGSDLRRKFS